MIASTIILMIKGSYWAGIWPSKRIKKASHTEKAIKKISAAIKKITLVVAFLLNKFMNDLFESGNHGVNFFFF